MREGNPIGAGLLPEAACMPRTSIPLERLEYDIIERCNGRGHYKERHITRLVNSWSVSNCTISAQSYEDKYPTTRHQLVLIEWKGAGTFNPRCTPSNVGRT